MYIEPGTYTVIIVIVAGISFLFGMLATLMYDDFKDHDKERRD